MTIEAALVTPFVLALMMLFLSFAQTLAAQLALRHAAAETVKEIAAHAYVLTFIKEPAFLTQLEGKLASLPAPLQEVMRAQGQAISEEVWKTAMLSVLRSHMERTSLIPSHAVIPSVRVPEWRGSGEKLLGIHVSYKHRLHVPFFSRDIQLHVQAYERLWTGEGG